MTLWDTKLFEQVQLAKRSQQTAVGDVYFNRHLYLQELDSKLDHLECKLRNCMAQTDRYVIDDDNAYMWILTPERNKEVFSFKKFGILAKWCKHLRLQLSQGKCLHLLQSMLQEL